MSVVYGTTANMAGVAIRNFRIGPSLSNQIGTSDSNSNQISKLRRSVVKRYPVWQKLELFDVAASVPVYGMIYIHSASNTLDRITLCAISARQLVGYHELAAASLHWLAASILAWSPANSRINSY